MGMRGRKEGTGRREGGKGRPEELNSATFSAAVALCLCLAVSVSVCPSVRPSPCVCTFPLDSPSIPQPPRLSRPLLILWTTTPRVPWPIQGIPGDEVPAAKGTPRLRSHGAH
uniref:Uncharacterized protein n=1 Tax=Pseudonaja textilis TaxID=8673 RepID=A0A670ZMB0_PSETE